MRAPAIPRQLRVSSFRKIQCGGKIFKIHGSVMRVGRSRRRVQSFVASLGACSSSRACTWHTTLAASQEIPRQLLYKPGIPRQLLYKEYPVSCGTNAFTSVALQTLPSARVSSNSRDSAPRSAPRPMRALGHVSCVTPELLYKRLFTRVCQATHVMYTRVETVRLARRVLLVPRVHLPTAKNAYRVSCFTYHVTCFTNDSSSAALQTLLRARL